MSVFSACVCMRMLCCVRLNTIQLEKTKNKIIDCTVFSGSSFFFFCCHKFISIDVGCWRNVQHHIAQGYMYISSDLTQVQFFSLSSFAACILFFFSFIISLVVHFLFINSVMLLSLLQTSFSFIHPVR